MSDLKKWAALVEILHIASLAHDDIIDNSPSRRGLQTQHLRYDKRNAVFSVASSQQIREFNSADLYSLYATAMEHLAHGEIIQALSSLRKDPMKDLPQVMQIYMDKSYYKTAALMAHALQAVPLFLNKNAKEE